MLLAIILFSLFFLYICHSGGAFYLGSLQTIKGVELVLRFLKRASFFTYLLHQRNYLIHDVIKSLLDLTKLKEKNAVGILCYPIISFQLVGQTIKGKLRASSSLTNLTVFK